MNKQHFIMKFSALMILVLLSFTGTAQNYQCLQPGVKHYFTNSNGYLRGIRIDSAKSYTDSTIFYPYHTARGRYSAYLQNFDTTGGSWLGKKVIQLNDGTFLFDNIWNDTAVIKTQAHIGDKWNLYDDTTTLYYQAEVIAEDTMTVLGVVDSIKRLLITARNPSGIVTADPVDSAQIVLSKNNGFVQIFDLYTFPYHVPDSAYKAYAVDYFLDASGGPSKVNAVFNIAPFKWPTKTELYNWNVGDAYEFKYCNSDNFYFDCPYPGGYDYDSVVSKVVFADSVQYATVGWRAVQTFSSPEPYVRDKYYPYRRSVVNKTFTIPNIPLFDTLLFPEEYKQPKIYYYFSADTTFCVTSEKYYTEPTLLGVSFYEGGGPYLTYKKDLNEVSEYSIGSPRLTEEFFGDILIYYRHNGISCGGYLGPEALAANNVLKEGNEITLFPNPAVNEIVLCGSENITSVELYNIVGQQIRNYKGNNGNLTINIVDLPQGLYTLRINGSAFRKFVKE
ncbi:MAG: hypothetical protein JWQ38_2136 [Flavipsychrobacter sp.]|nr:hypothetical protein [Flavipsychrobacter sp.]